MRSALLLLAAGLLTSLPAWAQYDGLIISEIVDGDTTGNRPKYVELYNASTAVSYSLGGLQIRLYSNEDEEPTFITDLSDTFVLDPGETFVINSKSRWEDWSAGWGGDFATVEPDTSAIGINSNGNDVYALYDTLSMSVIDQYGVIGQVNGPSDFSPAWTYNASQVTRDFDVISGNDGIFDLDEWSIVDYEAEDATPGSHPNINLTPTPVELVAFEAITDGDGAALLRWRTASEENNAGFHVEYRRLGGGEATFAALGFADGHGTTSEPQRYTFRAEGLEPGRHAFRLRQVDLDGTATYSPAVELEVAAALPEGYRLSAAHPNPFNPTTRFTLTVQASQDVRVEVFNLLGQRVRLLHDGPLEAGEARAFTFEAADLPSGLYLYRAQGETFAASGQVTLIK